MSEQHEIEAWNALKACDYCNRAGPWSSCVHYLEFLKAARSAGANQPADKSSDTPQTDKLVRGGAWGHGEANGVEKRSCSDQAFAVAQRIIGTNSFADPYTLALWIDHAWALERSAPSATSRTEEALKQKLGELCDRLDWRGPSRESNLEITVREARALIAAADRRDEPNV